MAAAAAAAAASTCARESPPSGVERARSAGAANAAGAVLDGSWSTGLGGEARRAAQEDQGRRGAVVTKITSAGRRHSRGQRQSPSVAPSRVLYGWESPPPPPPPPPPRRWQEQQQPSLFPFPCRRRRRFFIPRPSARPRQSRTRPPRWRRSRQRWLQRHVRSAGGERGSERGGG